MAFMIRRLNNDGKMYEMSLGSPFDVIGVVVAINYVLSKEEMEPLANLLAALFYPDRLFTEGFWRDAANQAGVFLAEYGERIKSHEEERIRMVWPVAQEKLAKIIEFGNGGGELAEFEDEDEEEEEEADEVVDTPHKEGKKRPVRAGERKAKIRKPGGKTHSGLSLKKVSLLGEEMLSRLKLKNGERFYHIIGSEEHCAFDLQYDHTNIIAEVKVVDTASASKEYKFRPSSTGKMRDKLEFIKYHEKEHGFIPSMVLGIWDSSGTGYMWLYWKIGLPGREAKKTEWYASPTLKDPLNPEESGYYYIGMIYAGNAEEGERIVNMVEERQKKEVERLKKELGPIGPPKKTKKGRK